jgi:hypothetical protein
MIEPYFPSASSTCRKLLPWFTVTLAARSSNLGHRTRYVLSCTGRKTHSVWREAGLYGVTLFRASVR